MTRADQLSELLVKWREKASGQLEELQRSMALSDDTKRLDRLSAASSELESLRASLEAQLRKERNSKDHQGKTHDYIDKVHTQCKELRSPARTLVIVVSQIVEQRDEVHEGRQAYTELQIQRADMVAAAGVVEDQLQDLFDSIDELAGRLRGDGDQKGESRSRDEESDEKPRSA